MSKSLILPSRASNSCFGVALVGDKSGHSCSAIAGPKGEGGLDDATGAGGAGGASMKQSSNTVDLGRILYTCMWLKFDFWLWGCKLFLDTLGKASTRCRRHAAWSMHAHTEAIRP